MIFTPEHCEMVLARIKTQTRRVVKPEQRFLGSAICKTTVYSYRAPDCMGQISTFCGHTDRVIYEIGKTYAIQPGRGKKAIGRLRIVDIDQGWLQDMSNEDAHREGYSYEDYIRVWDTINPKNPWVSNPSVWIITFDLEKP